MFHRVEEKREGWVLPIYPDGKSAAVLSNIRTNEAGHVGIHTGFASGPGHTGIYSESCDHNVFQWNPGDEWICLQRQSKSVQTFCVLLNLGNLRHVNSRHRPIVSWQCRSLSEWRVLCNPFSAQQNMKSINCSTKEMRHNLQSVMRQELMVQIRLLNNLMSTRWLQWAFVNG